MNKDFNQKVGIHQVNGLKFLHVVGYAGYQCNSRSKRRTNRNATVKNTSRRHGSYTTMPVKQQEQSVFKLLKL